MHGVYDIAAVRAAEQRAMTGRPEGGLMQRAAAALAAQCAGLLGRVYGAEVVLLVGVGNNGGDALLAGARLAARGARVRALLLDPQRTHADALIGFDAAGGRTEPADPGRLAGAALVVDGMFGIGGRAGLTGVAAELAGAARELPTLAVDLPSGVDGDTGAAGRCAVRADVTVTFGAVKAGSVLGPGAEHAGQLRLVDLGLALPPARIHLLEASDVAAVLPEPGAEDDKYTRGVVGVLAGSDAYPGAGVLATGSARYGGVGMVRYLGRAAEAIRDRYPDVVVQAAARPGDVRVQAWVVGPGLGTDDGARRLLAEALASDVAVLVDADAITLLAERPELVRDRAAPTVLTPHDREFARLAGVPGPDRLGAARRLAADLGATVLLKGEATVVAAPDGAAFVNRTGTPWLATAGSGDVLSGLVGSLLAAGVPAPLAAASGAYLHGVAGQLAASAGPATASDVLAQVRDAIRCVRS